MSCLPATIIPSTCSLRRSLHTTPFHKLRNDAFSCHQKKNEKQVSLCLALPFDLSPPPIDYIDPLETMTVVEPEDVTENALDNDDEALEAVDNGVAVVDLSNYGRIRVSGEDRIQFLHNQTTADFECLSEGQGCDTVFVTPTARTIDISHAWIMKNAVILVVSPATCGSITEMLQKYIFFADKVEIQDITNQTGMFALLGPKSSKVCVLVMEDLNIPDLVGQPYGSHKHYRVGGMPVTVAVGSIVSQEGFTFMMSPAAAGSVWKALLGQGAIHVSSSAWETLRILRGRPAPGKELTDEFNVLEAGCYKGQETISRLVTYDGIKQRLWGIRLSSPVEPGSSITVDGKKVGRLTSSTTGAKASEPFGLGYIKRKTASDGDSVTVGESVIGTLVEVPFLKEQFPPSKGFAK
ncbi:hypothetical protein ACJIZ3_001098 [Penstemon smallii]|uniref:Aminomethyltransferase n=1 Tax=Penstemon smallii TaxID=265156 RepID=A0ABD3U321_9LAMI